MPAALRLQAFVMHFAESFRHGAVPEACPQICVRERPAPSLSRWGMPVTLRTWEAGDLFRPGGRSSDPPQVDFRSVVKALRGKLQTGVQKKASRVFPAGFL